MSITVEVTCNAAKCPSKIVTVTHEVNRARLAARTAGWQTRKAWDSAENGFATYDYCPNHLAAQSSLRAQAPIHGRISHENCSLGTECYGGRFSGQDPSLTMELYDWCGHDNLGHRMANVLLRAGYDSVLLVLAAEEAELLDLRGFGTLCLTRYRAFKGPADATS